MELIEIEKKIIKEFNFLENWEEKYEYIIELGKKLPKMSKKEKSKNKLIKECQSKMWVNTVLKNKKIIIKADSDAILPKGLIAILIKIYSNRKPIEIINSKACFIKKIGFKEFLSPLRSNGLISILKKIKIDTMKIYLKYKEKKTKNI